MRTSFTLAKLQEIRNWHLSEQLAFLFVVSVVVAVPVWPLWQRAAENHERADWIQKDLEKSFVKVQQTGDSALLVPGKPHRELGLNWEKPKTVSIGSTFYINDHHFMAKYEVVGIHADGILIHYQYQGASPAREGRFSCTVKLKWKS